MTHPYANLPDRNFWRTGVAEHNALDWRNLYTKRFPITETTNIASAGSCFAQHIGRQLKQRSFKYIDVEQAPSLLPDERRLSYGYDMYSGRFGNIYTARQLLQLYLQAFGKFEPKEQVWEQAGRFYDPFRPSIEPDGFTSAEEVIALRQKQHLPALRRLFARTDVFIFTLGLTEAWINKIDGATYPVCPGTVAGTFDESKYAFHNFNFTETYKDMSTFISLVTKRNPNIKFLLTVSPVPLTATATDSHILSATTYSKSVLRAVAGELYNNFESVDYFPSYELVTAPAARGMFFKPNVREVTGKGVDYVMSHFFEQHPAPADRAARRAPGADRRLDATAPDAADIACDEEKLDLVRT